MKKSTDDLMNILKQAPSVDDYFDQNDNEIFFGSLSEMIDYFLARKNLTKATHAFCRPCHFYRPIFQLAYKYQQLSEYVRQQERQYRSLRSWLATVKPLLVL